MRGLGTSVASECFLCNLRRGGSLFSREHRYGNKQLQLRLPGPAKTQSERKGGSRTQLGLPRDRCHTWEGGSGVLLGRTAHGLATALSLTRFFPASDAVAFTAQKQATSMAHRLLPPNFVEEWPCQTGTEAPNSPGTRRKPGPSLWRVSPGGPVPVSIRDPSSPFQPATPDARQEYPPPGISHLPS